MARTVLFAGGLGVLVAWNWARLEHPRPSVGPLALMVALAVVPALLPTRRLRLAAGGVAFVAAACIALEVWPPFAVGRLVGRAGGGFLDFYDVLVPFNGGAHPLMHDVMLLAVFVFALLGALAVAARRPLAASLAVVAGAGWPSTILPGDDLARGALLFVAALALVAWLQPGTHRLPPQILTGTALVVAALIVSSSGSVAKGQYLDWQNWNLYTKRGKPVNVQYLWRANYDGITFPRKRTRVFTVHAPARSVYWRATTLDAVVGDLWDEDLISVSSTGLNPVNLSNDSLLPAAAADQSKWKRADVTIDALRDVRLVGPSQPVYYNAPSLESVQYEQGGVALASRPLSRGVQYSVWGYTPQPTPAQLAKSPPDYPPEISLDRRYLTLGHSNAAPPFGTRLHTAWARTYFRSNSTGRPYRPLYVAAQKVAGKAKNPYAAAVALEAWFRSSGGFTYDEQPGRARGVPALVQFVTQTKRGYCQHFSGAMALMLRYLGIPARVAAGFTSGTYDSKRGTWTVYDRDAHTWVEVWFRGYGWLPFDPTPSRGTLGGPYTTSSLSFDAPGAVKVLAASAGVLKARSLLRFEFGSQGKAGRGDPGGLDPTGAGGGSRARAKSGGGVGIGPILVPAALALVLLFVLGKIALRHSRYLTRNPRRIAATVRRDLVGFLLDQKIDVPRSIGPRELGRLLGTRAGVEATDFADALGRARFGPASSASAAAREARRELRAVRGRLRRALPLGGRVRGLFSLRSLLSSR
ncbi:MAG: DUF3488 and transglutaminase-like domain-containing protein [Actinomycetota bacterium]|nr:DUF3488 and transglutaminase-like domain-containing protein [Actinomycetota bacterium]